MEQKRMMILGATGSVGMQGVDVAEKNGCAVTGLSANTDAVRIESLARRFRVPYCAMANEKAASELRLRLADTPTKVLAGEKGICEMIACSESDVVLNSIIGEVGLAPTLAVIESGTRLALANKESLVVAGELVMSRARERGVAILPVDSEHSAIFQCLHAGHPKEVKTLWLTASGGPFFGRRRDRLSTITVEQALAHPTWKMGAKITIDSATLMNKGFEVIEAVHLFGVSAEQVKVVVHRQSIIHSMVEYIDNSVIAQLSVPDMRLCAQYALTYPERTEAVIEPLDLTALSALTFEKPDTETFALLRIAQEAIGMGGSVPAVLNAANEVAVAAFLSRKLAFCGITDTVCRVVDDMKEKAKGCHTLEEILLCDREARERASACIG